MVRDAPTSDWGRPGTLERAGSRLQYWVAGPDDGSLVVFTHGASMDHRTFDPQLGPVTDAGYRALSWDVRGHGRSKPMGSEFSVRTAAADLCAILDRLGAETATFVGHSFGGYVSQEVAFASPDRVTALAVIGSTNLTDPPGVLERLALRLMPALVRVWPDDHFRKTVAKHAAVTEPARRSAYDATRQLSNREFGAVWRAIATGYHAEPGYRVRAPLLLAHGSEDRAGTVARDMRAWAEAAPEARYEVIPDAGHNANQDNPEYFNDVLLSFLAEHVPP